MSVQTDDMLHGQPEAAPPSQAEPALPPPTKKKKKLPIGKIVTAVVALVLVAAAVLWLLPSGPSQAAGDGISYVAHTVARQDITVSLSGSGTLQPADSYTVTSLVEGEILADGFEEGDTVEKDALLYNIDSTDLSSDIQRAENALSQTRKSYEKKLESLSDLNIQSTAAGTVIELDMEVGDKVTAGQLVATVRDIDTMKLTLPFISDDAVRFYEGQSATVTLDGTFETLKGTVTKIGAVDELYGSLPVRQVTIEVQNPGGLSITRSASATVGDAACSGPGTFAYKDEVEIRADMSGEVAAVPAREGGKVQKGDTLIRLTSDNLETEIENAENSLKDAEITLQNQYDRLENYTITSPIAGTIIDKHFKAGDNAETGRSLCVIYDLSYLTMTLNVDELDVSKVQVGQAVTITAEAVSGAVYQGVVTKVSVSGTTSGGVTVYPVTIRIDETQGLLPGMNVEAEILVMNRENVPAIPVSALARGNRVLVHTGEVTGTQAPAEGAESGSPAPGTGMTRPEGTGPQNVPEGFTGTFNITDSGTVLTAGENGLPDGFEYVTVSVGESDGSFIEITQGLEEGDVVAYAIAVSSGATDFQSGMFGGMGNRSQGMVVEYSYSEGPMPAGGGQGPGGGQ